ncbi:MAG: ABC transporter permease [Gemmatimonadaceae bacterium]
MTWTSIAVRRLRALLRRSRVEAEMAEELRLHLEMEAAHRERAGLAPDEARRAAVHAFGGVEHAKEAYRDARGVWAVEQVVQDIRYGLRSLRAAPAFTAAVIITLALGIGASTAIFSVVHGVLLRALPYADPERIVVLWENDRDSHTEREPASVPDYFDYAARARSFSALAAFAEVPLNRTSADAEPERLAGARVTANLLAALGATPRIGRGFLAAEDAPGGPRVAIVSDRYWRTHLGGTTSVLGSSLLLDDSASTIVGVLPPEVRFPTEQTDVWVPMQLSPTSAPRSRHFLTLVGRLRANVSVTAANSEAASIGKALESEYTSDNAARGASVESLTDVLVGGVRRTLVLLLGAVALVLLIACANAASLLLARLAARAREVAVRAALGATRRRLAQQFFVESLLLTLGASTIGVALAAVGLRGLLAFAPATLPRRAEIALSAPVLAASIAVSVLVALAFGLLPALGGGAMPGDALQSTGSRGGTASREHRRFRGWLVVAEVALSLVLAVSAGLLVRSFERARGVDPGFTARRVLEIHYQLPPSRYFQSFSNYPGGWSKILGFQRDLVARAGALPGVQSAALAYNDPLTAGFANSFRIEGREAEAERGQAELATRPVSASYFATVGIPILRGRGFTERDDASAPLVVVINAAAATRYFANDDPLGKRIRFWGQFREIVGVVGNERFGGLVAVAPPAVYPVVSQAPMTIATLLVRTQGDPRASLAAVRRELRALDPNVAPFDVQTIDEALATSTAPQRFSATLLGSFAGVALVLALVGIYGVVAYSVAQRTREIGIRVALGATRSDVVREVLAQGLRLALAGCAIGLLGALAAGRLLASQLFAVSPWDPATFGLAITAIFAIAIVGSYVPARRAAGVQALEALRQD